MFKNPKFLLTLVFLIVICVVANRFYQYYINKNFLVEVNAVCDPKTETCFSPTCESDELGCEPAPYKKVEILYKDAPRCLEEHNCTEFTCGLNTQCIITYCSESTLSDGESCFVPETENSQDGEAIKQL